MAIASPACVAVAYSGGRDSTALLHAVCRAARGTQLTIHALHVHHGLSAHADAWQRHCEAQCRRWARSGYPVQLHVAAVKVAAPGVSIEAEARRQRYAALAQMAGDLLCPVVLLAHHRDDQAETVLLQALRGASAAGLSGMPREAVREGVRWIRPWLGQPRAAIESYVARHRLAYVDDDSNADPRWDRNRLRLAVWPVLTQAFPQAASALADVARQAQDARVSIDALADIDQQQALEPDGSLRLAAWQALVPARRRHLLRHWLHDRAGERPPRTLIDRLAVELMATTQGEWLAADGMLRLYRGRLAWRPATAAPADVDAVTVRIDGPGDIEVPAWHGVLRVVAVPAGGLPAAPGAVVELRPRQGGEQFQRALGTPPRSLKKQFQAAALPAWARTGPLVFVNGCLVFVPGLGIDARQQAAPGVSQWVFDWRPLSRPPSGDEAPDRGPGHARRGR